MLNQDIIQKIENLKGQRKYEEKKAAKLGFSSLYNYFEDKILKEKKLIEDRQKETEIKKNNGLENKENKSCSCC